MSLGNWSSGRQRSSGRVKGFASRDGRVEGIAPRDLKSLKRKGAKVAKGSQIEIERLVIASGRILKSGSWRRCLDKQLKRHFQRFPRRQAT